jgi:hypothetical protein
VQLHELPGQCQTEAEALRGLLPGRLQPHQRVEDPGLHLGRDAGAVVAATQHHHVSLAPARQHDAAARSAVLGRVVQQIGEHLLQAHAVGLEMDLLGRRVHHQLLGLRRGGRQHGGGRVLQQRPQDDGAGLQSPHALTQPGDVEQVVHQAPQHLHLVVDHPRHGARAAGRRFPLQRRHGGGDGRQRVAQLMAEHGQEGVLRARLLALLRGPLALADVHRHGHRPDHLPFAVADGRSGHLEDALLTRGQANNELDRCNDPPCPRGLLQRQVGRLDGVTLAQVDDLAPVLLGARRAGRHVVLRARAELCQQGAVAGDMLAVGRVGEGHAHRQGLQQRAQPLLLLGQRPGRRLRGRDIGGGAEPFEDLSTGPQQGSPCVQPAGLAPRVRPR